MKSRLIFIFDDDFKESGIKKYDWSLVIGEYNFFKKIES